MSPTGPYNLPWTSVPLLLPMVTLNLLQTPIYLYYSCPLYRHITCPKAYFSRPPWLHITCFRHTFTPTTRIPLNLPQTPIYLYYSGLHGDTKPGPNPHLPLLLMPPIQTHNLFQAHIYPLVTYNLPQTPFAPTTHVP